MFPGSVTSLENIGFDAYLEGHIIRASKHLWYRVYHKMYFGFVSLDGANLLYQILDEQTIVIEEVTQVIAL